MSLETPGVRSLLRLSDMGDSPAGDVQAAGLIWPALSNKGTGSYRVMYDVVEFIGHDLSR